MAIITVRAEDFRWLKGREFVARYAPEPPFNLVRSFCSACGTYLGEPDTHPKAFPISAHTLDDDPQVRPVLHEHVSSKPPWYEISDGLPEYSESPPLKAFFPNAPQP